MALQFQNILAGIAVWRRKKQGQYLVYGLPMGILQVDQVSASRRQRLLTQRICKGLQVFSADAHHADCAFACWRRHSDDGGIAFAKHALRQDGPLVCTHFKLRTPSCLLIIHCWAIDKILLVNQYSTNPEGKKKNMTLKAKGMIHISLA